MQNVFAVGTTANWRGAILQYDGSTWTEMRTETGGLKAVWGSSSSDVFAVGDRGTVLHFDGPSSADVYVVGSTFLDPAAGRWAGIIFHFDGANRTRVPTWEVVRQASDLYAVWGSSSGAVFAVGGGDLVSCLGS